MEQLKQRLQEIKQEILDSLTRTKNKVKESLLALREKTKAAMSAVWIRTRVLGLKLLNTALEAMIRARALMAKALKSVWKNLCLALEKAFNMIAPIIKFVFQRLLLPLVKQISKGLNYIVDIVYKLYDTLESFFSWSWKTLVNIIENFPQIVKETLLISLGLPIYILEKIYLKLFGKTK